MGDINSITISGNLGHDAEMKHLASGAVKASIDVAVTRWDKKNETSVSMWIPVELWGKSAEYIGEYAKKGNKVFIQGQLRIDDYESKDGQKKKKVYIMANEIVLINSKKPDTEEKAKSTKDEGTESIEQFTEDEEIPF